ncbi:MAG: M67 family metallopeptidase [candidate division NC10 bacterium]|nr:M67 family metallopeptidase [candidate division NC10 bacterium]MBI4842062.1 M67 family metallopeptidase [candidate division NC10 bacterium]
MTTDQRLVMVHALAEQQLREIVREAEAGYPEEICGIVIGKPGAPETYQVRQVRNIANQERQKDTAGFERDARTAYRMDDREVLRVLREADEAGWDVVTFYHSHPDHDAYFSAMDRDRALAATQEPLWPGAAYLVVSVREGHACDARYFGWDDTRRDFLEVPARLPVSTPLRSSA